MSESNELEMTNTVPVSPETSAGTAEALAKMAVCVRNVGLYGRLHPLIATMAEAAHTALNEVLAGSQVVSVSVVDDTFMMGSFPLEDGTGCLSAFAQLLADHRVGELVIRLGVTKDEVIEFSETLSLSSGDLTLRGGTAREMQSRQITNIAVRAGALPTESRQGRDPADIYEEAILLVEDAMKAVQSGLAIPVPEIRSIVCDSLFSLSGDESVLLALAGIKSYDRYLSEHSVNVCILSMVLARDLGMDTAHALELGICALLHDVGKVFIPMEIVTKPGKLTEEEWEQIRRHPTEGARALAGISDLPALSSTIALEHHTYMDGTGYPLRKTDRPPHLLSRLIAIVDTYDALTTDRPYREKWTAQQAIAWMLYEGHRQYDRQLLSRFAARAKLYPIGSVIRLAQGDVGVVVGGDFKNPTKPEIKLISSASGSREFGSVIRLQDEDNAELVIESMAQPVELLLSLGDQLAAA